MRVQDAAASVGAALPARRGHTGPAKSDSGASTSPPIRTQFRNALTQSLKRLKLNQSVS
jgi:hypothetical protein